MKKIFYLMNVSFAVLCMAFAFTACGGDDDDDDGNPSDGNSVYVNAMKQQLENDGYSVGSYTWNQLNSATGFLSNFPAFNYTAMAYLNESDETESSLTVVYTGLSSTESNAYANTLTNNGFSSYQGESEGATVYCKVANGTVYAVVFVLLEPVSGFKVLSINFTIGSAE